jgi:hypothetical protein
MKTNEPLNEGEESTYSFLVPSEEKTRVPVETVGHALIIQRWMEFCASQARSYSEPKSRKTPKKN